LRSAGTEETKSSAGDKYETQREMIKQNQDVLDGQLTRSKALLYQLNAISIEKQDRVEEGSLFQVSLGKIWVSVSFGKIELDKEEYQLISIDSPIFLALKNKKKGDSIVFRGNKILVEDVV
jgi:transcription elongation GreA/GreB family factor